jgi:GMP synthase-like glutamine amidotransferase
MILLVNNSTHGNKLSFIFQIRKALNLLDIPYVEVDKIDQKILDFPIEGIILSGSPMMLEDDVLESFAKNFYYMLKIKVPVLGICFGSQLLTVTNGGKLLNRGELFCQSTTVYTEPSSILFRNKREVELNFCFTDLPIPPKHFQGNIGWISLNGKKHPIAFDYGNNVFAILGHPELSPQTFFIYKNFYDYCKKIDMSF